MQLTITRTPNPIEKAILHTVSYLFRRWLRRGKNLLFWMVPQNVVFDHEFTVLDQGKPYSGNLKFGVDYQIFFSQGYEPQNGRILTTIAAYLAQHHNAVHFVDVGANVGFTSHLMLGQVDSIHSFEPHPQIFRSLLAKWQIHTDPTWQIHQFGLGAQEAELNYYEPASLNTGTGSFVAGLTCNHEAPICLPIRQGDRVFANLELSNISLMKIDVEGFEPFVLQGLSETLRRDRPVILMETSMMTWQILNDHDLSLQSLVYPDAVAVEIQLHDREKFQLTVKDFSNLDRKHQDLLILPIEIAETLLRQLEKTQ